MLLVFKIVKSLQCILKEIQNGINRKLRTRKHNQFTTVFMGWRLTKSSNRRCSVKKGVLHVLESLSNEIAGLKTWRCPTLLKTDSNTGAFLRNYLKSPTLKNICKRLLLVRQYPQKLGYALQWTPQTHFLFISDIIFLVI